MVKRNFNGGGWSSARDSARSGGKSGGSGSSGGASRPTGVQIHGGGGQNRGNQIQENIKRQQQQINENNRRRIEEMRNAQATPEQSIADRIRQEKIDTWVPTKEIIPKEIDHGFDTIAQNQAYQDSLDKQKRTQDAMDLAKDLRKEGVTADQLTDEEKDQLSDLQFMQDEGVYGGVSGYEAEINKLKKNIVEGGAGYEDALRALAYLSGTKGEATPAGIGGGMVPGEVTPNEELAKISALGVDEYLKRKLKVSDLRDADPDRLNELLTGGIEGLSPEFFKTFAGQTAGLDYGEDKLGAYIQGDALGYDPTGAYTWSDIESDKEGLYQKYLNRGTLWDDPLSGLFPKSTGSGGPPGGQGSWAAGYSEPGGGGGGYGWMLPGPGYKPEQMAGFFTPQANLQQAMINVHKSPTVFKKRGGIVSLLRLS